MMRVRGLCLIYTNLRLEGMIDVHLEHCARTGTVKR